MTDTVLVRAGLASKAENGAAEPRDAVSKTARERGAPTAAKVLLPVWGFEYVTQFLDHSLRTLLAPGNLPAIARALPTEFVFLTRAADEAAVRAHPAYPLLADVAEVRFHAIDDLVMQGNHSTTVTLAYARAVKETGRAARDTCFFFLVSDYLMADGSLAAVLARMLEGASAVQVGNFQTVEGEATEWLDQHLGGAPRPVSLQPRALMRWALTCMHPATIANTVNSPVCHNSHTNRLFWRVDEDTLIGRFYLMHMICIRPETEDFMVGASCDYSFVPEMCPSGNVIAITDSDEYLAVEVQPRGHEGHFVAWGPATPSSIAFSLSEWTTERHRLNVRDTIVYHAGELPAALPRMIDEATAFVGEIAPKLSPRPQPYRDHPYWRGAIAALEGALCARLKENSRWAVLSVSRLSLGALAFEVGRKFYGRPPEVERAHPRWADFQRHCAALNDAIGRAEAAPLLVSSAGSIFADWIARRAPEVVRVPLRRLLQCKTGDAKLPAQGFDCCIIELQEADFGKADEIVEALVPLLRRGAEVLVVAFNQRWFENATVFGNVITAHAPLFWSSGLWPEGIDFATAGRVRWWLNGNCIASIVGLTHGSSLLVPLRAVLAPLFGVPAMCANLISSYRTARPFAQRITSSVLMRLRYRMPSAAVPGMRDDDEPAYKPALAENPEVSTREPQYNRLLDVQHEVGLTSLGLMTNQVWHDDPRRLTFILARYKFVSKMLSGRRDVAELGCGDAFGTRIVQQEVERVTVYDFDPIFIADIERRQSPRWPLRARVHDILDGPLPYKHDAIYSLDVIEHVAAEQEHVYVENLAASLDDDGVLIVGSPSLESQSYASPQSKEGHINCKSGRELKALLERYFHTVFLFSMNDEVVHTGFYPMAHYLFALCSDPKPLAREAGAAP